MTEDKMTFIRPIMGRDGTEATAKERYNHIPESGINALISDWHAKQPERDWRVASPSRLLSCPRVVWLMNQGAEPINNMGWGVKQRLMLGRLAEQIFARQFEDEGILAHWWQDDPIKPEIDQADKFTLGEGDDRLEGTPDFLLKLGKDFGQVDGAVAVSDSKTLRSDGLGYVPIGDPEIWEEWNYYKIRIQLTAYFMLCEEHWPWFQQKELPKPDVCHFFSYALDDGIVRREEIWTPTKADMDVVREMTRRFNQAVHATKMPACTCKKSYGEFDVKFCPFAHEKKGKIGIACCDDSLSDQITKKGVK